MYLLDEMKTKPPRAKEYTSYLTAEQRLITAVIARAIADASNAWQLSERGRERENARKCALMWLTVRDQREYSFAWCCEQLGYDVARLRKRIKVLIDTNFDTQRRA